MELELSVLAFRQSAVVLSSCDIPLYSSKLRIPSLPACFLKTSGSRPASFHPFASIFPECPRGTQSKRECIVRSKSADWNSALSNVPSDPACFLNTSSEPPIPFHSRRLTEPSLVPVSSQWTVDVLWYSSRVISPLAPSLVSGTFASKSAGSKCALVHSLRLIVPSLPARESKDGAGGWY